jgi:hypothetical protein
VADSDLTGTLVVGLLTIESSADPDVERPASSVCDIVQFWMSPAGTWKIRTYAIEGGMHAWEISDHGLSRDGFVAFARNHLTKNYGDVLARVVVVELAPGIDRDGVNAALTSAGLGGHLTSMEQEDGSRVAVWLPDGTIMGSSDD